ncbi:hypothetical protein [Bacillus bombysepticus]|uniref:hypothetical protein n=1 Tax=Bacillus bombysepticus TaxID=658666 RepID=UPI003016E2B5
MDNNNGWRNRDWIWLVGILVVLIILLIAGCYNSDAIELNFSIISSAVSIALALVAIFIALKQDSDNQQVNSRVSHLLNEISANIRNMDAKVDKIDPRLLHSVTEEVVEEYSQESKEKESFTKEEVDKIVNKVSNDIASNINVVLNNRDKKKFSIQGNLFPSDATQKLIHKTIDSNRHLSLGELQIILEEQYGILLNRAKILEIRDYYKNLDK